MFWDIEKEISKNKVNNIIVGGQSIDISTGSVYVDSSSSTISWGAGAASSIKVISGGPSYTTSCINTIDDQINNAKKEVLTSVIASLEVLKAGDINDAINLLRSTLASC